MNLSSLIVDVESTIKNKGHPFTPSNKLCAVGLKTNELTETLSIQYDDAPFGRQLDRVRECVAAADILVGFNIKFDLHWLRRYGIDFRGKRVFDCQLAYFIQRCQEVPYPSLNEAAEFYGLPTKLDVVEQEYWKKGLDTPQVPWEILSDYLRRDLDITAGMYQCQLEWFLDNPKLHRLLELQCEDLLVLEEMEWNGLLYDKEKSLEKSREVEAQCSAIVSELNKIVGGDFVNWNSPEHVSAVLYGGVVKESVKEKYQFHYKDPKREPVWKTRTVTIEHILPRLYEPLPNTSLVKDGLWSTSGSILTELATGRSPKKRVIECLLELAELSKRNDYYAGIPKLMDTMEWSDSVLHGNLNQCRVVTGRLSSDKPNQQNMPEEIQELIRSRYEVSDHAELSK